MKRSNLGVLIGTALFFIMVIQTQATPIISVDMDPAAPGIQDILTVNPGSMFTVDVVIGDDGQPLSPTIFDTVILEVSFNDMGPILAQDLTGPTAGALAGSPTTLDIFGGFVPTSPGQPLGIGDSMPQFGYGSGSGAIGLLNFFFLVPPGLPTSIFSIDFVALDLGTSDILAAGTPLNSPELSLTGNPIFATLETGTVNVVPEPTTILLLAIGMLGMGAFGRKKFKR